MARKNGAASIARAACLGALTLCIAPAIAFAQGGVSCSELSLRLSALDTSADGGEYGRAIATQRRELHQARLEEARLGCGFSVKGRAVERCASLAGQTADMEDHLADLTRRAKADGDPKMAERSRLVGLLASNGCSREPAGNVDTIRTAEAMSGVRILGPNGEDALGAAGGDPNHIVLQPPAMRGLNPNGAYRTMCVRTCDGYYFPISYAVTPAQFTADEQACAERCPGTEVELFYHRVPEEDAEQMVSVSDGTPYTALPHAFLYRKLGQRIGAGCSCRAPAGGSLQTSLPEGSGFRILSPDDAGTGQPISNGSIVTLPAPVATAPATAIDPAQAEPSPPATESASPRAASAAASNGPAKASGLDGSSAGPPAAREPVRVVGPKFFPDPSEAEVLRAPGPRPGQ